MALSRRALELLTVVATFARDAGAKPLGGGPDMLDELERMQRQQDEERRPRTIDAVLARARANRGRPAWSSR